MKKNLMKAWWFNGRLYLCLTIQKRKEYLG